MKSIILASAAVAAIAVAPALAQPAQPGAPVAQQRAAKVQTRADLQARIARLFARLDVNRDGFVTQAEAQSRAVGGKNRDAQRAERRAPGAMFDRLDTNKDGQITQAEADAVRAARQARAEARRARAQAAGGGLFARVDANHDGVITRSEFDAAPRGRGAGMRRAGMMRGLGARMFGMADLDKDGRVSLAEAQQAALQRFDRSDLNHDGQLTPEERRQAREQFRSQRRPS
ncbi:MAG: calcium-binding protein [Sphingomicrobium sp.]